MGSRGSISTRTALAIAAVVLALTLAASDFAATETLVGGPTDDVLAGTPERDHIDGRRGRDEIRGLEEGDLLEGGYGADSLHGDGDDTLFAEQNTKRGKRARDEVFCGPGFDRVYANSKDMVADDCERVSRR